MSSKNVAVAAGTAVLAGLTYYLFFTQSSEQKLENELL